MTLLFSMERKMFHLDRGSLLSYQLGLPGATLRLWPLGGQCPELTGGGTTSMLCLILWTHSNDPAECWHVSSVLPDELQQHLSPQEPEVPLVVGSLGLSLVNQVISLCNWIQNKKKLKI